MAYFKQYSSSVIWPYSVRRLELCVVSSLIIYTIVLDYEIR